MKAIVVYESLWGNTSAVAHAIADGLGLGETAMSTAEATPDLVEGVDLIVAGSPVFAFKMPTEKIRQSIEADPGPAPTPPDLSHPSMGSWLQSLPRGEGYAVAFDTQARGPFGSAAPQILKLLQEAGYQPLVKPAGFIVKGKYGPLRAGELERAREFGKEIAVAINRIG
jgi:hypothetical protein